MKKSLILALVCVCFAITLPAFADDCDNLTKTNNERGWFQSFKAFLSDSFLNDNATNIKSTGQLYFSVRSGFSLLRICDAGKKNQRFDRFLYYPTGIVFELITDKPVTVKGEKYLYVLSQYGLKMYIPEANLTKMDPAHKEGYIFVDGANNVPYCATGNCKDPTTNKDWRQVLTAGAGSSSVGRYGVVAGVAKDLENECRTFRFYPFELKDGLTRESAYLTECWEGFKKGKLKIKHVKNMRPVFDSIHKLNGKYGSFSSKHFARLNLKKLLMRKKCSEEHKYTKKGELSVGGNYYVFSSELGIEYSQSEERKKNMYHYFSHYGINGKSYAIESISSCPEDAYEPDKPKSIKVYHENIDDDYFNIKVQTLINKYKELFNLSGYVSTESNNYRRGKYFKICGPGQYYNLRDTIHRNLKDATPQMDDIIANMEDFGNTDLIYDFYTNLIIASSSILIPNCGFASANT